MSVSCPSDVQAPKSIKVRRARSSERESGASNHGKSAASPHPDARKSNNVSQRSTRRISETSLAGRASWSVFDQRRIHRPGPVRPARPARCSAEACEIGSTKSVSIPRNGSKRAIRAKPESMTARIPGIVTEVSATLVETIIFRFAPGRTARSCSSGGNSPCKGRHSTPRASGSALIALNVRVIS